MSKRYFPSIWYEFLEIKKIFLENGISESHARHLICDALNLDYSNYYLLAGKTVISDSTKLNKLASHISAALNEEPFQYTLGYAEFWKYRFNVTCDTLIPRPETEIVVEKAIEYLKLIENKGKIRILDLGTGSGIIAICLKKEFSKIDVLAADLSEAALKVASQNAFEILGNNINGFDLIQSDWYSSIDLPKTQDDRFDLIVSNPPYISHDEFHSLDKNVKDYEPSLALTDYSDGLAHYKKIIGRAHLYLKKSGTIILEHGYNQREEIEKLLIENGLKILENVLDLAHLDRILIARYDNH